MIIGYSLIIIWLVWYCDMMDPIQSGTWLVLLMVAFGLSSTQITQTHAVHTIGEISLILRDANDRAVPFPEENRSDDVKENIQGQHGGQGQGLSYKLTIPIKGYNDLVVWLRRPHTRLMSRSATSEWSEGGVTTVKWLPWGCIYEGFLDIDDYHGDIPGIMMSLCGGLTGIFEFNHTEWRIEPILTSAEHRNHSREHMISSQPLVDKENNTVIDETVEFKRDQELPHLVNKNEREHTKSRHRRDLIHRNPRHMEVLLVADQTVVSFHGRRLVDQYLLTIMNIVNSVYHHPSLGIEINIVVTDIVHLSDAEMRTLVDEGQGKDTLQKFCNWTNTRWHNTHKAQQTENMFDVAVYLTRENLGPAGYAPVTGMCNPLRSCAVIRDDGISSAFVVAHEIGHIFGMVHDGEGQAEACVTNDDGKIMSPMVQSNYRSYYWSNCSKEMLEDVLEEMYCLENEPGDTIWPRYSEPYGQTWTLEEQCRQEFGADFVFCKALPPNCEHLWCENPTESSMCKTKRSPPLSGTNCGKNMWCLKNQCVNMKDTPRVDGGWAEWSDWGSCSRSCNVGIKYRYRTCTAPTPQYGGKECDNSGEDFKLCNKQDCPEVTDFRWEQCREYNEINFVNGVRHNWLPIESKNMTDACKLTCISEETGDLFTTEKNVIDGTPCSYESSHNICIRGDCHPMGCDQDLSSDTQDDLCGTCGGDNSGCTTVGDTFTGKLGTGQYHQVVILPAHAMNIRIRETSIFHLAHFLAIRDLETGKFWLNGESKQEGNRQFVVHKTRFLYFKNKNGEYLTARGPLLAPVEVLTYSFSDRIGVELEYQYYIQEENHLELQGPPTEAGRYMWAVTEPGRYMWAVTSFNKCTRPCGGGTQREMFECLDVEKNSVSEGLCTGSQRPAGSTTPCNERPCSTTVYIWRVRSWQKCSASCGMSGMKWRKVYCEATLLDDRWEVDDRQCYQHADTTPNKYKQCNRMACPAQWKLGDWSECSVTCGEGQKMRAYFCDKPKDSNKYTCDHLEPPRTHKPCLAEPCPGSELELPPVGSSEHHMEDVLPDEYSTTASYTRHSSDIEHQPTYGGLDSDKTHYTDTTAGNEIPTNINRETNTPDKPKTRSTENRNKNNQHKNGATTSKKGDGSTKRKDGRKKNKRNRKASKKGPNHAQNRKKSAKITLVTLPMKKVEDTTSFDGGLKADGEHITEPCIADLSGLVCKLAANRRNCLANNIYKKLCCKSCMRHIDI